MSGRQLPGCGRAVACFLAACCRVMSPDQLHHILAYRNDDVVSRFTDQFAVSETEAEDIFTETLKFLYLSQLPTVFIPDDLLIVDEMWHNFILFTPAYVAFCKTHFQGEFFHHVPASRAEKQQRQRALAANAEQARQVYLDKLAELMRAAYDHLGEATVRKWFQQYPEQYSKTNITALRRY